MFQSVLKASQSHASDCVAMGGLGGHVPPIQGLCSPGATPTETSWLKVFVPGVWSQESRSWLLLGWAWVGENLFDSDSDFWNYALQFTKHWLGMLHVLNRHNRLPFFFCCCCLIITKEFLLNGLIKSYLRSTMSDTRHSSLGVIGIHPSRAKHIDMEHFVSVFAQKHNNRKIQLSWDVPLTADICMAHTR